MNNPNPTLPADFKDQILQLIYDSGTEDKNALALIAIKACIAEGLNTKSALIGFLGRCGFKRGHIASVLDPKKGPYANAEHWRIDENGRYHLHDEETVKG